MQGVVSVMEGLPTEQASAPGHLVHIPGLLLVGGERLLHKHMLPGSKGPVKVDKGVLRASEESIPCEYCTFVPRCREDHWVARCTPAGITHSSETIEDQGSEQRA